jgi:hypothetical protein
MAANSARLDEVRAMASYTCPSSESDTATAIVPGPRDPHERADGSGEDGPPAEAALRANCLHMSSRDGMSNIYLSST